MACNIIALVVSSKVVGRRVVRDQLLSLLLLLLVASVRPFVFFRPLVGLNLPKLRNDRFEMPTTMFARRNRRSATPPPPGPPQGERSVYDEVVKVLRNSGGKGAFLNRMNPNYPKYDKQLHGQWKQLSQASRTDLLRLLDSITPKRKKEIGGGSPLNVKQMPSVPVKPPGKKRSRGQVSSPQPQSPKAEAFTLQQKIPDPSLSMLLNNCTPKEWSHLAYFQQALIKLGGSTFCNKLNKNRVDYDESFRRRWDKLSKKSKQFLNGKARRSSNKASPRTVETSNSLNISGVGSAVSAQEKTGPEGAESPTLPISKSSLTTLRSRSPPEEQANLAQLEKVLSAVGHRSFNNKLNKGSPEYDPNLRQRWELLSVTSRQHLAQRIRQSAGASQGAAQTLTRKSKKRGPAEVASVDLPTGKADEDESCGVEKEEVEEQQQQQKADAEAAEGGGKESEDARTIFGRLGSGMESEVEKMLEGVLWQSREAVFEERVREFIAVRATLGGSETAEEVRRLESLAGFYGCENAEALVERFATFWNRDRLYVRAGLVLVAEEVASKAHRIQTLLNNSTLGKATDGIQSSDPFEFLGGRGEASESEPKHASPFVAPAPSTSDFPANDLVDSYHEECKATMLKTEEAIAKLGPDATTVFFNMNSQPAPTGPALAGASLEELSAVTLDRLLVLPPGGRQKLHSLKLELTVVRSAFLAMRRAVTAVVADSSGQHVRLAMYNTGATSNEEAQKLLPLGGRFTLKQPWLKRGADQWLSLRVEEPAALVAWDVPQEGNILVVGDGDFSFSHALAHRARAQAHVTATSLDQRKEVQDKYAKAQANLQALERNPLATVLHGVDATRLAQSLPGPRERYDTVLWNFPYPVRMKIAKGAVGRGLIEAFFESVKDVLTPEGKVRVVLARGQGGSSREAASNKPAWSVETAAEAAGFDLLEVVPFNASLYPGYLPRREFIDQGFPAEEARVHIFGLHDPATPASSRERHFAASLGSVMQQIREPATTPSGGKPLKISPFEEYAASSVTAREVVEAGQAFQKALAVVETLAEITKREEDLQAQEQALRDWARAEETRAEAAGTPPPILRGTPPMLLETVQLLEQCYASRDGMLVAEWSDPMVLVTAVACTQAVARAAMMHSCGFVSSEHEPQEITEFRRSVDEDIFAQVLHNARDLEIAFEGGSHGGVWMASRMSAAARSALASALFVHAHLVLHRSEDANKLAVELLSLAIDMRISHAPTFRRRAQLLGFEYNRLGSNSDTKYKVLSTMYADSAAALELDADDDSALYAMAFALRNSDSAQDRQDALELYEKYLEIAEPDDRQRPAAHYNAGLMACLTADLKDPKERDAAIARGRQHYQKGIAAEAQRLPCFPPVAPFFPTPANTLSGSDVGAHPSKSALSLILQVSSAGNIASTIPGKMSNWFNMFGNMFGNMLGKGFETGVGARSKPGTTTRKTSRGQRRRRRKKG